MSPVGDYTIRTVQSDLSTINRDADNYASNYDLKLPTPKRYVPFEVWEVLVI